MAEEKCDILLCKQTNIEAQQHPLKSDETSENSPPEGTTSIEKPEEKKLRWPPAWPGVVLAIISIVGNVGLAIAMETTDLYVNLYPEYLPIPVFLYWVFFQYKHFAALKSYTATSYGPGPLWGAVNIFFAGPVAFFLAALVAPCLSQWLGSLSVSNPPAYDEFLKNGGLFIMLAVIAFGYIAAGMYTGVVALQTCSALSKFSETHGVKRDRLQPYLVTAALISPGIILIGNSWVSYDSMLIFAAVLSLAFLTCFLSFSKSFKRVSKAVQ